MNVNSAEVEVKESQRENKEVNSLLILCKTSLDRGSRHRSSVLRREASVEARDENSFSLHVLHELACTVEYKKSELECRNISGDIIDCRICWRLFPILIFLRSELDHVKAEMGSFLIPQM
jgi:hypothetical protein